MPGITAFFCCLAAGLHAACFGAYKDSPHESFILKRFVRELEIAWAVGLLFFIAGIWETENCLVVYLSAFTVTRVITEFWKLNLRVESQAQFRIPTQIHVLGKVVNNRGLRILLGLVTPSVIAGVYFVSAHLPASIPPQVRGLIVGLLIGLADASGGAYKDGYIEGFYLRKFLKSSFWGPLGGFVLSFYTNHPLFHLLATIGFMRMFLELIYKILVKDYVPGKFKSMKARYPEWLRDRKWFLLPYALTWTLFVVFLIVR